MAAVVFDCDADDLARNVATMAMPAATAVATAVTAPQTSKTAYQSCGGVATLRCRHLHADAWHYPATAQAAADFATPSLGR
jgi:hypothetical protein